MMQIKRLFRFFLLSIMMIMVVMSCSVEEELCADPYHPHTGEVRFTYAFSKDQIVPDSMIVVANRVIKRRLAAMVVNSTTSFGHFRQGEMPVPTTPGTDKPEEPDDSGDAGESDNTGGSDEEGSGGDSTEGGTDDGNTDESEGGNGNEPEGDDTIVEGMATRQSDDVIVGDDNATDDALDDDIETQINTDWFRLPVGVYRFLTFNFDEDELEYVDFNTFLEGSSYMGMKEIYGQYKLYDKDDPKLRHLTVNWQDHNPYTGYIQPDIQPLYIDTLPYDLGYKERAEIEFKPKVLTQNVDVYFTVKKKIDVVPFIVDSVFAEISGVPIRINLLDGSLAVDSTGKMMFRTELMPYKKTDDNVDIVIPDGNGGGTDGEGNADVATRGDEGDTDNSVPTVSKDSTFVPAPDEYLTDSVRCHANINVTGFIAGSKDDVYTGPGIMQVLLFIHAVNPDPEGNHLGPILRKKIQGKVNLYHTLREARLTDFTEDWRFIKKTSDHGVLDVKMELIIDGESIIEHSDNGGGIDIWIPKDDDTILDI